MGRTSIMPGDRKGHCYLCTKLHEDHSRKYTEKHHIFGGPANRMKSDAEGLTVYLCQAHHRGIPGNEHEAVHRPDLNSNALMLQKEAEDVWIRKHIADNGGTIREAEDAFRKIFGKSWL